MTDAEIAAQIRKLLNAYPLGDEGNAWPLDQLTAAAEALERREDALADLVGIEAAIKEVETAFLEHCCKDIALLRLIRANIRIRARAAISKAEEV